MKKFVLSAFTCLTLVTANYASGGEDLKIKEEPKEANVVYPCNAKFVITNKAKEVVDTHNVSTTEPSKADCEKVMGAAKSIYEAFYGPGYTVELTYL